MLWEDDDDDDRRKRADGEFEDEDEEEDQQGKGAGMFGFLFGNIDEKLRLDEDYLDEDAKAHLADLSSRIGSSIITIQDLSGDKPAPQAEEEDYDVKDAEAINYEDINELAEEQPIVPQQYLQQSALSANALQSARVVGVDEDDYDTQEDQVLHELRVKSGLAAEPATPQKEADDADRHDQALRDIFEQLEAADETKVEKGKQPVFDFEQPFPELYRDGNNVVLRFSELFHVQPKPFRRKKKHRLPAITRDTPQLDVEDDAALLSSVSPEAVCQQLQEDSETSVITAHVPCPAHRASPFSERMPSSLPLRPFEGGALMAQVPLEIFNAVCLSNWENNIISDDEKPACVPILEPEELELEDGEVIQVVAQKDKKDKKAKKKDFKQRLQQVLETSAATGTDDMLTAEATHASMELVAETDGDISMKQLADNSDNLISLAVCEELSRTAVDSGPDERRVFHEQLLRLHTNLADSSALTRLPSGGQGNAAQPDAPQSAQQGLNNADCRLRHESQHVTAEWLKHVDWQGSMASSPTSSLPKPILWDLSDPAMVFEAADTPEGRMLAERSRSAITVVSRKEAKTAPLANIESQLNISNDRYYGKVVRKVKTKQKGMDMRRVFHSKPALLLKTTCAQLRSQKNPSRFHRPKAVLVVPLTKKKHAHKKASKREGKSSEDVQLKLKSLVDKALNLKCKIADTVAMVKQKIKKKWKELKRAKPLHLYYMGQQLPDDATLSALSIAPGSTLYVVAERVQLLVKAAQAQFDPSKPKHPTSMGGGAFRKLSDMSGKTPGHIRLMEYSEEHPLLLSNIGMGAKYVTYYSKTSANDTGASNLAGDVGTVIPLAPEEDSPFLANVAPGQSQACLETNMYHAPIFAHTVPVTDFLLVRTSSGKWLLREINSVHVVGQQEPHLEVFPPGGKSTLLFVSNYLLVHAYREFRTLSQQQEEDRAKNRKSASKVVGIKLRDLQRHFPALNEMAIRKRLRDCADYYDEDRQFVLKRGFQLPSEEELRKMVSPDMVCAYESMLTGVDRLRAYGVNKLTSHIGINDAIPQLPAEPADLKAAAELIDNELQMSSWNLTSNFMAAMQGKLAMQITGSGDPSGHGHGFSYLQVAPPKRPKLPVAAKKLLRESGSVTGTDADLRRLSMDAAREVLLKFGVPEKRIAGLTRWQRIGLVREMSGAAAAAAAATGEFTGAAALSKYARGNRSSASIVHNQQHNREHCQAIFDKQAQVLSSFMVESGDKDSFSDMDAEFGDFDKDLEDLLAASDEEAKPKATEGLHVAKKKKKPQEEPEDDMADEIKHAAELRKMLQDDRQKDREKSKPPATPPSIPRPSKKVTRIKRIIKRKNPDGTVTERVEFVTDPEEVAKILEKKRGGAAVTSPKATNKPAKAVASAKKVFLKATMNGKPPAVVICGACGQQGHIRTDGICPLKGMDADELVKVDGTKFTLTAKRSGLSTPTQAGPEVKLKVKVGATSLPSFMNGSKKKRVREREDDSDDSQSLQSPSSMNKAKRARKRNGGDVVGLANVLEPVINALFGSDCSVFFRTPVLRKELPDYFSIIRHPMDLSTMKEKVRQFKYTLRSDFRADVKLIRDNAYTYNEKRNPGVLPLADRLLELCDAELAQRDQELTKVEPEGDDDVTQPRQKQREKLVMLLDSVVAAMRDHESSYYFRMPVKDKEFPDYRQRIARPMDLATVRRRNRENKYANRHQFRADVKLIVDNAHAYNDESNPDVAHMADRMLEFCDHQLERIDAELAEVEDEGAVVEPPPVKRRSLPPRPESSQPQPPPQRVFKIKQERPPSSQTTLAPPAASTVSESLPGRSQSHQRSRSQSQQPWSQSQQLHDISSQPPSTSAGNLVKLSGLFRSIIEKLLRVGMYEIFRNPVSKEEATDYHLLIRRPVWLTKIKANADKQHYQNQKAFRRDVKQLVDNAHEYNDGRNPGIPPLADQLLEMVDAELAKARSQLAAWEVDTGDAEAEEEREQPPATGKEAVSRILDRVLIRMIKSPYSLLFHLPVPAAVPDYYSIVTKPMDLETIQANVRKQVYSSGSRFRKHVKQIVKNAHKYNDSRHPDIPPLADQLMKVCDQELKRVHAELRSAEEWAREENSGKRDQSPSARLEHLSPEHSGL
eukprot:jgi/Chlat1/2085/Chrsp17S02690